MKRSKKKSSKLHKIVYKGRLYTGYNKVMLQDYILSLKR